MTPEWSNKKWRWWAKKVVSFSGEKNRGDTAELAETVMTKKGRQFFKEKIEGWHAQLPRWVSPTLVMPLSKGLGAHTRTPCDTLLLAPYPRCVRKLVSRWGLCTEISAALSPCGSGKDSNLFLLSRLFKNIVVYIMDDAVNCHGITENSLIHSFFHLKTDLGGVMSRTPNNVKRTTEFVAQDANRILPRLCMPRRYWIWLCRNKCMTEL